MSHGYELADFYRQRDVRARKDHKCSACCETIPKGKTYRKIALGGDGTVETVKQCGRCRAIFDALQEYAPQEPILPRLDCGESWEDTFGEPEPPDVAALAFMLPGEMAVPASAGRTRT